MRDYDVIIVGGGAAGLMAASRSAERGRRTLVVEKANKPGVKILMSGGTRCNLTHDCDERGIIAAFGSAGPFLHGPLAALGPRQLVELFQAEGLPTKIEDTGKVFPQSDRAADVVEALVRRLKRCGAELALGEAVRDFAAEGDGFRVTTAARTLSCETLLVTVGGKSYPGCGTIGEGYAWLAALGHTIRKPRPALVPLTSDEAWICELAGVTMPDVRLRVVDPRRRDDGGKRRARQLPPGVQIERRGSLLFAHFGLSGPVAMDVSREVTGADHPRELIVEADWLPDVSGPELEEQLLAAAGREGKKHVVNLLPAEVPHRLAATLVQRAAIPFDRRGSEMSKTERQRLVRWLKAAELRVSGSRGFDKAEVTAGGVALDEVDSRTMASRRVPHLFLAGEILDLDGFIGGYNFQAAFSTGWVAGSHV